MVEFPTEENVMTHLIMARQGDVLLERVDSMPDGLEEVPRDPSRGVVLALGESTNHAHAISDSGAILFRGKGANDDRFLRVLKPVSLRHEEHAPIDLPQGLYRVRRQIEWTDADEPRVVAD